MEPLVRLTAVAMPLDMVNVDTDQIIPARFLNRPREDGLADTLFHDLRLKEDGTPQPGFALNQSAWKAAGILVADANFGCGSSRENAVHALLDWGFRVVIAPSFGDIFFGNCFKNGVLPIVLPAGAAAALRQLLHDRPGTEITVDLQQQSVTAGSFRHTFEVDSFRKDMLLRGQDELSFTLGHLPDIVAFERAHEQDLSWL